MIEVVQSKEFARHLMDNDARIDPTVIGAVATALIPKWDFKSELVAQPDGMRTPQLSLHRLLGPFCDEHDHNDVLSNAAAYLKTGRIGQIMEHSSAELSSVISDDGESDFGIIVSRATPPNGMYSRRLFGELFMVELELSEAQCVQPTHPNIELATILLS